MIDSTTLNSAAYAHFVVTQQIVNSVYSAIVLVLSGIILLYLYGKHKQVKQTKKLDDLELWFVIACLIFGSLVLGCGIYCMAVDTFLAITNPDMFVLNQIIGKGR